MLVKNLCISSFQPFLITSALIASASSSQTSAILIFIQNTSYAGSSVQSNPTHHFGRNEMLSFTPYLPNFLYQAFLQSSTTVIIMLFTISHISSISSNVPGINVILVNQIHQIAERIILPLMISIIADTHRFGVFIS